MRKCHCAAAGRLPNRHESIAAAMPPNQVALPHLLLGLLLLPALAAILVGLAVWSVNVDADTDFNWAEVGLPCHLVIAAAACWHRTPAGIRGCWHEHRLVRVAVWLKPL